MAESPKAKASSGFDGSNHHGVNQFTSTMSETQIPFTFFILRSIVIVTTFIGTIVMGVAKETTHEEVEGGGVEKLTLKSIDFSQLEYFIAVNAIALVYGAASLGLSIFNCRSSSKIHMLILAIVDLVMVALLFSGIGSASAVGTLAQTCKIYGKFCGQMAGAIVVSMFGALAFFGLVVVYLVELFRRSI